MGSPINPILVDYGPMSEQIPGIGGTSAMPNIGGMGGSPIEKIKALLQAVAAKSQATETGPTATPGRIGQQIPGGAPPFVGGGPNIPMLPNMTAGSQTGPMPGVQQPNSPVEFRTPAGRNAQIVRDAIGSVSQVAGHLKQKAWDQKSAQAEQAWGSYVGLQQAIANTQDPDAKKMLQKQLEAMMQDPKIGKIFSKAHEDPTSPEGVGLQRAMQMSQQQASQQALLEKTRNEAQAEAARAQREQAQAALYQKQTSQEGEVTPKAKFDRETEMMKFNAQQAQKGFNMEVRGLSPAVKGPDGKTWSWSDMQDPVRSQQMPPDAKIMLAAERQSKVLELKEQEQHQQRAFGQQMAMWDKQMEKMQAAPLIKGYGEDVRNAMGDNMRLARMQRNGELAKRGDSQAMIALLSDHVNMTLRQPGAGAMRVTLAQWKEAEVSAPFLSRIAARFSPEGFLVGVTLAPEQIDQMIELGVSQREIDWMKAQKSLEAIQGISKHDVRMPDPNMPGLPPLDIKKLLNPTESTTTAAPELTEQEKAILDKLKGK